MSQLVDHNFKISALKTTNDDNSKSQSYDYDASNQFGTVEIISISSVCLISARKLWMASLIRVCKASRLESTWALPLQLSWSPEIFWSILKPYDDKKCPSALQKNHRMEQIDLDELGIWLVTVVTSGIFWPFLHILVQKPGFREQSARTLAVQ